MATLSGNLAIGYVNRASGRTVTATTAATGYAASNLNTPTMYSATWRSTTGSLTNQNLDVDLGSSTDIDVFGLLGFNGQDGATRTPKLSENADFSSPEYNPGSGNAWDATTYPALANDTPRSGRHLIIFPGSTQNSRYGRLTLNDNGNPDNRLKGSVLWYGPIWSPSDNFQIDGESFKIRRETVGEPGMETSVRIVEVSLPVLTEGEARQLESVCAERLRSRRLLVVPRPLLPQTFLREAGYYTLPELPVSAALPTANGLRWATKLVFREVED